MKDICSYIDKFTKKLSLEPVDYEREYATLFGPKMHVSGYTTMIDTDGQPLPEVPTLVDTIYI